MQTEALFMGKRIIIEHELKMLDRKRELLGSQLNDIEEYTNG